MTTGKHENDRGRLRRKVLGLPVVGWLILAMAGAAWALIMYTSAITGTVNIGSPEVAYSTGAGVTTNNPDCSAVFVDAHNMAITWNSAFPDDTCQLSFAFSEPASTNTVDMRLQDVIVPTDLTGSTANCGLTITAGGSSTPGASITITVDSLATYGDSIDLGASSNGIQFVETSAYVAGNCPST